MKRLRQIALVATVLVPACSSVGERTQLSVAYYSISGESFAEIDQQIALHGPTVTGVGKALAATNIRMVPDFRFAMRGSQCEVVSALVSVKAHVTLPRLATQQRLRQKLSKAWNNLEQYARLHESIHVSIADGYAVRAEEEIRALEGEPSCEALREKAIARFRSLMVEHERDQLQFDLEERVRIANIVRRTQEQDLQ